MSQHQINPSVNDSDLSFDCFIVKVTSRCNLNCPYCYVFNMADQTWRDQPAIISPTVVRSAAQRIVRHAIKHDISDVLIILHGGEPLLMGLERMQQFIDTFKAVSDGINIRLQFALQTNGTLLNAQWAQFFAGNRIAVGISMDGTIDVHDLYRVDHAGRGTYDQTITAITQARLLNLDVFDKVLCVIHLQADPIATFEHFKMLGFTTADFLLPDGNYESLPPGKSSANSTEYGEWLIQLFDHWFDQDDPQLYIRFFGVIIDAILGKDTQLDAIGGAPVRTAVIETNGEIQPLDVLKSVQHQLTSTKLSVVSSEIDELCLNTLAQQMFRGREGLCTTCQVCKHYRACGGGYFPHRFSASNQFDNPSIYCADLYKLISHIECRMAEVFHVIS